MPFELLDENEVEGLEKIVDDSFGNAGLPTTDLYKSRWALCIVGEDTHRRALLNSLREWHGENGRRARARFYSRIDQYKYTMRHALELCDKQLCGVTNNGVFSISSEVYGKCAKILHEDALNYAYATRIFSSFHVGGCHLAINRQSGLVRVERNPLEPQYNALEVLLGAEDGEDNPMSLLANLFLGPMFEIPEIDSYGFWSEAVHEVVKRARIKRGNVKYTIITKYLRELFEFYTEISPDIPEDWVFPWGSASDCKGFFAAIQAICVYHVISVHFGAIKHNVVGGGLDQICLHMNFENIAREIASVSGVDIGNVESILTYLTYGNRTQTPDPALQPFIGVGEDLIAVPCIFVLSSNWPRNMLSLHARLSPTSFDSNSSIFERRMLAALRAELVGDFQITTSIHLPVGKFREEIDIVLVDEASSTVLLCELRWMIQPGDVREVINRKKVVAQKVGQAKRKLDRVNGDAVRVIRALKLNEDAKWNFRSVVVVDGFGGAPSSCPNEIPVVPKTVFVRVLNNARNLDRAHAVLCSPLWLPREGRDFQDHWEEKIICGVNFSIPMMSFGDVPYLEDSLPVYIEEALVRTDVELRSMPWY